MAIVRTTLYYWPNSIMYWQILGINIYVFFLYMLVLWVYFIPFIDLQNIFWIFSQSVFQVQQIFSQLFAVCGKIWGNGRIQSTVTRCPDFQCLQDLYRVTSSRDAKVPIFYHAQNLVKISFSNMLFVNSHWNELNTVKSVKT